MMIRDEISTTEHYQHEKHAVSWGILWGSYVLATLSCAIPVFFHRKSGSPAEEGTETSSGDATRNLVRFIFVVRDSFHSIHIIHHFLLTFSLLGVSFG